MSPIWQKLAEWSPWRLVSSLYQRLTTPTAVVCQEPCEEVPPGDMVILQLADLQIHVRRQKPVDVPHEITVVVPRVEIHRKYNRPDGCSGEEELIYNSVTVVHAPRHKESGQQSSLPPQETECNSGMLSVARRRNPY